MVRPSVVDPPEVSARLWEGFGGEYGWDVGANCGQSVAVMAQLFTRFTCFEPCRESCDFLRGWYGGDVRQLAVSDHDGEVELAFPAAEQRETGQLVTVGIKGMEWEPEDWNAVERVTVSCRTADSLAAELGVPDFIKVDTEGHEAAVLQGAQGLLGYGKTDFLIEFHSPENYKACRLNLEGARYWTKTVRHPHYPEGSPMWQQHGWIKAFAPNRLAVSGSMGTALVTGAAGFVGRHFTKHLTEQGWRVWAIDIEPAPWLTFYRMDALDFFRDAGPDSSPHFDLVLHCAAQGAHRQAIDTRPMDLAVNFELDAAMFRWALRARPGRVVYFSSSAAYPVSLQKPGLRRRLDENDITFEEKAGMPDQIYGWIKLTGEYLARTVRAQGLAVSVVRPFSGYGEDQDDCFPFPAFVDRAIRREDPFLVWGDGNQVRDFIHIDDIVAAVMAMYAGDRNGPVNLATGQPVSMRALALAVCREAGYSPRFEYVTSAPSGVSFRAAAVGRLFKFYRPKITLEEGIRRALEYRARMCQPVPD